MHYALLSTTDNLANVLRKAQFWEMHRTINLNDRQRFMLNKLLEDFVGKVTSSKWVKITKCSQDTATRGIQALVAQGIFMKEPAGGRSTSYCLKENNTDEK